MRVSLNQRLGAAALLVVMLLMGGCASGVPTPALDYTPEPSQDGTAPDLPDVEVVATVNGQPIALEAYSRELARFEAGRAALGFEVSDEQGYRQQILDLLIEEELIRQAAAAQGIVVSEDQVTAELAAMIAETGEEYFRSWLQTNYYSEDEFREVLRLELMTSALLDPVIAAVPATAEHVHARHILVSTEAEAQTVVARLQAGEDFGALAAEYSTDITTRDRGGDLGWFPRGGLLVPEVDAAAFALAPGQISGMLPTAWGYHIVQTLEFDPAREVDAETRQRLLEQAIEQWRLGLRSGADIQQMVSLSS